MQEGDATLRTLALGSQMPRVPRAPPWFNELGSRWLYATEPATASGRTSRTSVSRVAWKVSYS